MHEYYFTHKPSTRENSKIQKLIFKEGMVGYGILTFYKSFKTKKMKTLIFLLIANLGLAQSLTPQFGIHWTGGMTYDNDHEAPSAQVGLIYTPKMKI